MKAVCGSQASTGAGEFFSSGDEEDKYDAHDKSASPSQGGLATPVLVSLATPADLITPSYATKDMLISEEFPVTKKQEVRLCGWLTTNETVSES